MSKVIERITHLVTPAIAQAGYELLQVDYQKEGEQWFLRLFLDHPNGVQIEDCMKINEIVSALLDAEDPIPQEYILEVSSPGVFRPLTKPEHFTRFLGQAIRLSLFQAIGGSKKWLGRLTRATPEDIEIVVDNRDTLKVPYTAIAKANLEPELKF